MTATTEDVKNAIEHARTIITEWDDIGGWWSTWREDQTRYAIIDPIIRALGWNTADPKECSIEHFIQNAQGDRGWADYALYRNCNAADLAEQRVPPSVLIEAKALRTPLDAHVEQLEWYVMASKMKEGVAVLTNGNEWWLYHVSNLGSSWEASVLELDITGIFGRNVGADILCKSLAR